MNDQPFGFGPPSDDDPECKDRDRQEPNGPGLPPGGGSGTPGPFGFSDPNNPFAAIFGQMNAADLGAAFQQLGQMLSNDSGPVNWELARDVARQTIATGSDPSVSAQETNAVEQAVRLAELWLDEVTTLPAGTASAAAWSRAEWVEVTLPVWKQLVEPVAGRVVEAMADVVPAEMRTMTGPLMGVMRSMGGAMFGAQVGQALGSLATEVVGSTDVGLPLGPAGHAALLPRNVSEFGDGLGIDAEQIRLYLALREAAHHRLFGHVPWLRAHLFGAVEGYARGIRVDTSRLEEAVGQLDPTNPEALAEALSGGMFAPEETPEQKVALVRLETALALVEGWVDSVVEAAAARRLPAADALRETVRRRRASGGPAEQTFATLVGLELRPRRLRDAATLWRMLADERGIEGRDAVWGHPDLLPDADDLDDPAGFAQGVELDLSSFEDVPANEPRAETGEEHSSEEHPRKDSPHEEERPDEDGRPRDGAGDA